jgi:hypothetical protein
LTPPPDLEYRSQAAVGCPDLPRASDTEPTSADPELPYDYDHLPQFSSHPIETVSVRVSSGAPAATISAAAEVMWRADDGTPVPEDSRHRGMGDWRWCDPMARLVRPAKRGTSTAEAPIAESLASALRAQGPQPEGIRSDAAPRLTAGLAVRFFEARTFYKASTGVFAMKGKSLNKKERVLVRTGPRLSFEFSHHENLGVIFASC